MLSVEDRTEGLNRLIRGELSAIETYRQALDKMKDAPEATELHAIMVDHRTAAQVWREHVTERGGNPADSSGPWGGWAKFVEGAAQLFGNAAALKALKEGEEHGIKEYETFLADSTADDECKELARTRFLPQCRSHIAMLDQLIEAQK
jgi:rubrerythrin